MLESTLAADMTGERPVPSVSAAASLREAAAALVAGGLGAVAVNGESDRLLGLLSAGDIVGFLVAGEDFDETTAGDVVVPADPLSPDDTHFDALSLMVVRGVSHLPVMAGNRLVGIVSANQMLREAYRELEQGYMRAQRQVFGPQVTEG